MVNQQSELYLIFHGEELLMGKIVTQMFMRNTFINIINYGTLRLPNIMYKYSATSQRTQSVPIRNNNQLMLHNNQ